MTRNRWMLFCVCATLAALLCACGGGGGGPVDATGRFDESRLDEATWGD